MKMVAENDSGKGQVTAEGELVVWVLLVMVLSFVPVVKELVVSAGKSVQITLPKNEVQLNAYVLPEPEQGKVALLGNTIAFALVATSLSAFAFGTTL